MITQTSLVFVPPRIDFVLRRVMAESMFLMSGAKETERSRPLVVKRRPYIYRRGGKILSGDEED